MKVEERDRLIDELFDGVISEADFLRLEAEMHINSQTREAYYERLKLHTVLQLEVEGQGGKSKVVTFPVWRTRLTWWAGAAAAALVLFAGSAGWKMGQNGDAVIAGRTEPTATGFAVLAGQSEAIWENGRKLGRGDLLPQGLLKLESGMVQLELFSGVTVIMEGQSEFEVISPMEMSVNKGRMRALVPEPARGFRVHTAAGDVVDLGTEFALDVTADSSEVLVLNGEVEWHSLSEPVKRLVGGESIGWTTQGEPSDVALKPGNVSGISDLEKQLLGRREQRREIWLNHSQSLRKDPRLLAYYPMDQVGAWNRKLLDTSGAGRQGTIVRAQRVTNRWGQDYRGLDFSPTGSRVRVNIPGEYRSVTFYCWVRIDSLDRWYNSLFLTDGHELHEPHWQIMDDGRLFFSVKKRNKKKDKYVAYSPPIWTTADSGKWKQIVTVYNVDEATIAHYVNGEQISVDKIPPEFLAGKVRIGAASIGNWSEPMRNDPHFALRNLNGVIDEFAIFSVALTADEISDLYEIGKP